MAHYVVLFSPESYQTFTAAPHSLIIPARRAAILKRVQVGDTLLAYLPALTRWIGALTVTAPAEPLDAFKMKVAVQVETWLPLERGVPVSHPRVWGSLTLTRGRDKDMTSAIPTLRTTFTPLDAADGQFLVSLLAAHAENEVIFSYDEAAYAKRIGQPLPRADGHQVRALVTDLHDMDIEELFSANIEARDTVRAKQPWPMSARNSASPFGSRTSTDQPSSVNGSHASVQCSIASRNLGWIPSRRRHSNALICCGCMNSASCGLLRLSTATQCI